MRPWTVLLLAGLCEVAWVVGLKYTDGFRRLGPSLFVAITLTASMVLLAWAARTLPIGTAYAVWTGIGALGAAIFGILLFREPATPLRLLFIGLLITSLLGLKVTG
jgi:quaternary ammonium compound-resistance protein SugE